MNQLSDDEARVKRRRRRAAYQRRVYVSAMHFAPRDPRPEPSSEALAERERAYAEWRPLSAELMGDPPPGRSALERRRANASANAQREMREAAE